MYQLEIDYTIVIHKIQWLVLSITRRAFNLGLNLHHLNLKESYHKSQLILIVATIPLHNKSVRT